MAFVSDARELDVFKKAYAVSLKVHQASLQFPKLEQYALADQLRRASKSICANLIEGFSRQSQSKVEFKRFVTIAVGSAEEVRLWLSYAHDLGYTPQETHRAWIEEYDSIIGMLVKLRNNIR